MSRPALEVADIFRDHGAAWRRANAGHVSLDQLKVMSAIERCRTAALGGHVARCENEKCAHTVIAYNSCRNRHCPKCQGAAAREWLAEREAELLPVPYFHVVYTLPAAIADIAYQNKAVIYDLLFKASAETTLTIAADAQASRRSHRLHLRAAHLGLRPDPPPACAHDRAGWRHVAGWIEVDRVPTALFLARAGALALFRRLFLQDAAHGAPGRPAAVLRRPCPARPQGCIHRLSSATAQDRVGGLRKEPFAGPEQVLRYLSRYTHRVAISNRRLIAADQNGVTFKYKDYRIEGPGRYKTMTLATDEFIRRFLIHVLPKGFHRIRHYGLFANGNRAANIARARELLAVPPPTARGRQARTAKRAARVAASMPVLRRPHDHHRDLRARMSAQTPPTPAPQRSGSTPHDAVTADRTPLRHLSFPLARRRPRPRSRPSPRFAPRHTANRLARPAAGSFTPPCSPLLYGKPIAATAPAQPRQAIPRGSIPIAPAAPPLPHRPRFRALALFGRRPHQRVEGLVIAGVRKPAQTQTSGLDGV